MRVGMLLAAVILSLALVILLLSFKQESALSAPEPIPFGIREMKRGSQVNPFLPDKAPVAVAPGM